MVGPRGLRARIAVAAVLAALTLAVVGCSDGADDDAGGPTTTVAADRDAAGRSSRPPSSEEAGASGGSEGVEAFDVVEIRPALSVSPAAEAPGSGGLEDADGLVYELGDPLPDGIVVSAEAAVGADGGWVVALGFSEGSPGIDDFNALAAECEAAAPSCPTGQVAIVADGRVLAAPRMIGAPFEPDAIQVFGLDEVEARMLAAALG